MAEKIYIRLSSGMRFKFTCYLGVSYNLLDLNCLVLVAPSSHPQA